MDFNDWEDTFTMSTINKAAREINCKIVYCGPGFSGKATNIQHIYDKTSPDVRGQMISRPTETGRTLVFDFLPVFLNEVRGNKVRLHLYTVSGPVFYDASIKQMLKGVDGVVFVADSQRDRLDENQASVDSLNTNLMEHGYSPNSIPFVIQYNKRDLPEIASVEELRERLNPRSVPDFESTANTGVGVFDPLKAVAKLLQNELRKGT